MTFTALRSAQGRPADQRLGRIATVALAGLVAAAVVAGCEEVGAPDAYRSQICSVVRSLAGPLPSAVDKVKSTAGQGDAAATSAALDAMDTIVAQINANLVDVPLWQVGAPAVTDLRAIGSAYKAAMSGLRTAVATGDAARIQTALGALDAARDVAPALADDLHAARLKGLNC